ncbi:MAG: divalent-cation tolerance protein CutA [Rhodospirillales bacterium]|nr:divalent-cation tolerance protein CutA [Rhodospirillales bacterium]MCW8862926.1 divalent-cation tolerance protein CutA [Rhodospirillales bacterium]MCW8951606.1 divalent-cation tolerance protein CutA [Rhodospirillales bacterium]MCW9003348.1 divalent-cation tolerance protein CutA [Rhodospirillales bacterium]MCW9039070.1 divalent-cation tolerance protein CutA [Rhodospirillales bacterium]
MELRLVYVTASSKEEAVAIGIRAVEEKLVACANVLDGLTSIYRWEGAIAQDAETLLVMKTTAGNIEKLTQLVKSLHSYTCPCVVTLPILEGNQAFLDWIVDETAKTGP